MLHLLMMHIYMWLCFAHLGQDLLLFLRVLFPFGVLRPVCLVEDAGVVVVKPSFGKLLELCRVSVVLPSNILKGAMFTRVVSFSRVALRLLT